MKLIHKFSTWYLVITLFSLAVGGVISYQIIKAEIDFEQAKHLEKKINYLSKKIKADKIKLPFSRSNIEVREIDPEREELEMFVSDTLAWHNFLNRLEPHVKVTTSRKINGKHYFISVFDTLVESDDITEAVLKSLSWIFLIMLLLTAMLSMFISKKILAPFHNTLMEIQNFRLRQKNPVSLPATQTKEFQKLNGFLEQMTGKARQDYQSLKEFTENASHELQTPLAIVRGKLELLMESNIDDEQAKLLTSANDAVDKLSKLGQSLTLLMKLENREFEMQEVIDFSRIVKNAVFAFNELIEMKSIRTELAIEDNVQIKIHPVLADILLTNLLSNAIRHNYSNGTIAVKLSKKELVIENSGEPLQIPVDDLVKRFRKSDQSNDSLGLGLSIVNQICEQNNMKLQYRYSGALHTVTVIL